jgi:hypothetical protein
MSNVTKSSKSFADAIGQLTAEQLAQAFRSITMPMIPLVPSIPAAAVAGAAQTMRKAFERTVKRRKAIAQAVSTFKNGFEDDADAPARAVFRKPQTQQA